MTKHKWKDQYTHISSASNFHNRVRAIFATDPYFSNMRCYQEVPVSDLVTDYQHTNHYFDWYVEELKHIIELHGQQHYKVVNYGNIGYDDAQRNLLLIKDRDNMKKTAALEAGYEYTEISFKEYEKLDAKRLKELIFYG